VNDVQREFGVKVGRSAPRATSLLAPERATSTGRYTGEGRRSKDRSTREQGDVGSARPRPSRPVRRALLRRPVVLAGVGAVVAVALAAAAVVAFGGGSDDAGANVTSPLVVETSVAATPGTSAVVTDPPITAESTQPDASTTSTVAAEVAEAYESWSGTFSLEQTVVDGNAGVPVGEVTTTELEFDALCRPSGCTLERVGSTEPWVVADDGLTLDYEYDDRCPNGAVATIRATGSLQIVERDADGAPRRATGSLTRDAIDISACPGVVDDPVTNSVVLVRTS
jgi:hypothetical protein